MRTQPKLVLLAGIFLFGISQSASAQVYGSNIFEFQYGNLPHTGNPDLTTSYDQLNLYYDSDNISVFGRVEQFLTPFQDRNYTDFTQKRIQYQDDTFRIRIGNFYETLGRGLLLRSYDIPGSVFEGEFERTRYAFFRDLEGIAIDYNNDWAEIKVLRAEPLLNNLPPNFEPDSLRRPDLVEAIQGNFILSDKVNVGAAVMRTHAIFNPDYNEYASLMLNIDPIDNIQYFAEYAFNTDSDIFGFNDSDSYALYTGVNFYLDDFGGSLEFKDYRNFRLGQGFNDPPSLIKEHTYPVLNRSTHVLETSDETGFQGEVYYNFEGGHSITANVTTATNDLFRKFEYREYFLEGYYQVDDFLSLKSFFDYANDDFKDEKDRISVGFIVDKSFDYTWGTILDLQYQTFDRVLNPGTSKNYYASLAVSKISDFTISAIFEATTDPELTDNPTTFPEVETDTRTWFGGNVSYKINSSNRVAVFAGKRRGGPACTSGICYEILDFEGVELRFSTRF